MEMHELELKELVCEATGKETPEEAFEETLRGYLEQKIFEYKTTVQKLQGKYRMSFEGFEERLGADLELSWQHEKDYMAWEEAVTNLNHFQEVHHRIGGPCLKCSWSS